MRTGLRAATALMALMASAMTLVIAVPVAQAATAPRIHGEAITLASGHSTTVKVLANDKVAAKARAKIRLTSTPQPLTARLTHHRAVLVTAPTSTAAGTYKIGYRVTDKHGKHGTAIITVTVPAAPADAAPSEDATLLSARISALTVTSAYTSGYDRTLFKLWIDADNNGCDTRQEVLIAEATITPTIGTGCKLSGGSWSSYYDGVSTTDPSTFDIDHLVPLGEVWASGGYAWDANTRMRYANDLDDARTLVAVDASINRSKGDRDPAQWMPPANSAACRYLSEWVAIKTRWGLTVDPAEKDALTTLVTKDNCPNASIPVIKAPVTTTETITPAPTPAVGVHLTSIVYDPAGDDATDEAVTLVNDTTSPVDLNGWKLSDAAGHTYTFPTSSIPAEASFTVRAPTGTNVTTGTAAVFYAGWGAVWNNSGGDTATITTTSGTVADTCTYDGTTGGTATC